MYILTLTSQKNEKKMGENQRKEKISCGKKILLVLNSLTCDFIIASFFTFIIFILVLIGFKLFLLFFILIDLTRVYIGDKWKTKIFVSGFVITFTTS